MALSKTFNVQLEHDEKETTWEDHGFVQVLHDGKVLAEADQAQHNRLYHERAATMQKLALAVVAALQKDENEESAGGGD